MNYTELFEALHKAISQSEFGYDYKAKLNNALDHFFSYANYCEDIALHGRDSDDAEGLVMCKNDPLDFINIDLNAGLLQ